MAIEEATYRGVNVNAHIEYWQYDPENAQDIFVMYWWPDYVSPYGFLYGMFRSEEEILFNLGYYRNPEFDEMIDIETWAGRRTLVGFNFMLEPAAAIAVAEGQNYPPSLDPSKVKLTDKIKKMPAFDPTGKLEGYLFANPSYWNAHQVEFTEKWDRIKAGS